MHERRRSARHIHLRWARSALWSGARSPAAVPRSSGCTCSEPGRNGLIPDRLAAVDFSTAAPTRSGRPADLTGVTLLPGTSGMAPGGVGNAVSPSAWLSPFRRPCVPRGAVVRHDVEEAGASLADEPLGAV